MSSQPSMAVSTPLGQPQGSLNQALFPSTELRAPLWQMPYIPATDMTASIPVPTPTEAPKSVNKQPAKKSQKPKPKRPAAIATLTNPSTISIGTQTSPVEDDSEIDADTIQQIFNDPSFPSLVARIEEILQSLYPT